MTCKSGDDGLVLLSPQHPAVDVVHHQEQVLVQAFENKVDLEQSWTFKQINN